MPYAYTWSEFGSVSVTAAHFPYKSTTAHTGEGRPLAATACDT